MNGFSFPEMGTRRALGECLPSGTTERSANMSAQFISTGSITLDLALGGDGLPRGRITEIFGPAGSGKTTLCQSLMAHLQQTGGRAAFVGAKETLDPLYASRCGVNLTTLSLSQPQNYEQALQMVSALVQSRTTDAIVIDAFAALPLQEETEETSPPGTKARLMSQTLRNLVEAVSDANCAVIFITKISESTSASSSAPAGKALRFYAFVRLATRNTSRIKPGLERGGTRIQVKVVKNRGAPPFRWAAFDITDDEGISREGELLDLGQKMGLLTKDEGGLALLDVHLGQEREQAKAFLRQQRDIAAQLEEQIRSQMIFFRNEAYWFEDEEPPREE